MSSSRLQWLRHPLLLLGFGFMLQMCASNAGQGTTMTGTSTGTGTPDGGTCVVPGDCPLPSSVCNAEGSALIYYVNPSCTNHSCGWTELQLACACVNGGCVGTSTAGGAGISTTVAVSTSGGVSAGSGFTTAGPAGGFAGISGSAGESGAGGLGDRDASGDAADAALQACNTPDDCTLPSSYCKDTGTLVFAEKPMCTAHLCQFTFSEVQCHCSGNGCIGTTTK